MKIFNNQALARFVAAASFLLVTLWYTLPAHAASLSVMPAALSVTAGQTFSVDVFISGVSNLYGFQFDVGYDPAILSASIVSEGVFLPQGGLTIWGPGLISNPGGIIDDNFGSLQSIVPGVDGSGVLASISFTAQATGSSDINLFDVIFLDSFGADIEIGNPQNASITVGARTTPDPIIPEPTTIALLAIGLIGLASAYHKR